MKVGWIGLGEMGGPMASRALTGGHSLTVYDRGVGLDALRDRGADRTDSYTAVAEASELLCLCLYGDDQVRDVLLEQGVLAAMCPGAIVAVHTTGSPLLAKTLHSAPPGGVSVLDAAFSGTPAKAQDGQLTLMVGGDASALAAARAVFETYASAIHHVGGPGAGQSMKLVNNILFAANLRMASQALAIARGLGLSSDIAAVLRDCSGGSAAMGLFDGEATPERILAHVAPYLSKDIASAVAAAAEVGVDLGLLQYIAGDWNVRDDGPTA